MKLIWVAGQIVTAYLLTDFLSGVLHWLQDRYLRRDWPVIGPILVVPNELHHAEPAAFTRDGFLIRNWASFLVAIIVALGLLATGTLNWFTGTFAASSALLPTQAHYWAHRAPQLNGPVITWLQRVGVIQSQRHHFTHHRGDKDIYFCTMTNWVNPMLERIRFFQRLETLIERTAGIAPKLG